MAFPNINRQHILDALRYIDENGIPSHNQSMKYDLITDDGKKYPTKYVVAVADHLANGTEISTEGVHGTDARSFLKKHGFCIEAKQERYELIVTANDVSSTDERFTMDDLTMGDHYKPLDVFFQKANGEIIKRNYRKGEKRNSNQTMPRLACQIFEKQIVALSVEEKENFPICQYKPTHGVFRGIYDSLEGFRKQKKTLEYLTYHYDNGRKLIFYCWNIFSTLLFVQECLKRFGAEGDRFVLSYREKETGEINPPPPPPLETEKYRNPYSEMLMESKNIIFRGAPGTGKSYLAREIATDIISNGYFDDYTQLSGEQRKQVEFVQFHPSYDYSDFVEGLRPQIHEDGTMGFALQDGIFKKFIQRTRKNYEDSQKSKETIEKEISAQDAMENFFSSVELGVDSFETINGSKFFITSVDERCIYLSIPGNVTDRLVLNTDEIRKMLESGEDFKKVKDIASFFGKQFASQAYSYDFAIYKAIKETKNKTSRKMAEQETLKKYIFIIDEINRGEISKIFGELFFAIDPGYRGRAGEVSTQYANLHMNPEEKFYVPDNVYIIGTMNDIDRSVDSFDFAMRRRFRFIELKAENCLEMLSALENEALEEEAIQRMTALNQEIVNVEELNENYQIGPAYFLKLKHLTFDQLWTDYLQPLLQDYIQGMYDERAIMKRFEQAYGYKKKDGEDIDAAVTHEG